MQSNFFSSTNTAPVQLFQLAMPTTTPTLNDCCHSNGKLSPLTWPKALQCVGPVLSRAIVYEACVSISYLL